jgi:hypothetical protein
MEAARERLALDQELDFETGQQDLIEHPDGEFRLARGEAPHAGPATAKGKTLHIDGKPLLYASSGFRVYEGL